MKEKTYHQSVMERINAITGTRTQTELAELLEIRQSSISDARRRKSIPTAWVVTLFRKLGANPDWIETGAGPMYLRTDKGYGTSEECANIAHEHMTDPQASPIVVPVYSTQCRWEKDNESPEFDIIGRLALPRSHAGEHIRVYKTESEALAPLIRKGACVGIDTALRHPTSGETFAVGLPPEGVVFRKLWLQPGSTPDVPGAAILRAESPDYPESAMRIDDFSKIVIGRLVWALQAF